jgi:hypothetical protein
MVTLQQLGNAIKDNTYMSVAGIDGVDVARVKDGNQHTVGSSMDADKRGGVLRVDNGGRVDNGCVVSV